jgi:PAS domain S-box
LGLDFRAEVIRSLSQYQLLAERGHVEARVDGHTAAESEAKFRSVAEISADAVILAASDQRIIFWNRRAEDLFGYTEQEVLGKRLDFLIPERHRKAHLKALKRATSGSERVALESRTLVLSGRRKDGTEFPMEVSFGTWLAAGDAFYSAVMRRIEEPQALQDRLELARLAMESMPDMLLWSSADGRLCAVSSSACRLLGYERDELLKLSVHDIEPGLTPQKWRLHMEELRRLGNSREKGTYRRKDGSLLPVDSGLSHIEFKGRSYRLSISRPRHEP